ncbi:hypothetical protein HBI56_010030 [Parastagonospora nodorum]|nr:hypothetical protein HBH51_011780 [Parastagonospora nodorum]KAH3987336.1 hypothetical protein HBH52_035640 [Parastagonospora nodorum]KAH4000940.1 hypothetical protein HBI10_095320 [Parastagonospora nodorum]KAH4033431.1 hypothetical protein HBI13_010450 [Parastagonospora nodorum]KAH4042239.1 hypothetical protein HBI09_010390 [Parastagonospora nodorum]
MATFRQLLCFPASTRTALLTPQSHTRTYTLLAQHPRYISLPRVLQPSFWSSMIPKPFKSSSSSSSSSTQSKEWNPATPYIILGLLVGSQAIQILWLKQDQGHSLRKAEAKIGLLREVVQRVQRGEDVDVEGVLGTGDEGREGEWAEILKDMENEEVLFQSKKKRAALRKAAEEEAAREEKDGEEKTVSMMEEGKVKVESVNGVRFY